jgi:hypothetical protein
MWLVQKYVMRAKRVIVNQDWEVDEGKLTRIISGKVLYNFLETCSDLANNKTSIMACGIPAICKASGLSRSTVIRCLAIARRHRFLIDTGERLPAPYDTIMYMMDPWVFFRLQYGYLDTYYATVDDVMDDLGFDFETAAILHFQHDIYEPAMRKLCPRPTATLPTWEEEDATLKKLIDHPEFYRHPSSDKASWKPAQRRAAFLKTAHDMGLPDFDPAHRPYVMSVAEPAGVAA